MNSKYALNFNYVGASFIPCGKDKAAITLGDLAASENFIKSCIQFWTDLGGNKRVTVGEFVNVKANYVYWPEDCGQVGEVAGWYLEDDQNGKYPQNDIAIPLGSAFIVSRYGSEADETVNFAGMVNDKAFSVGNFALNFNYVGAACPRKVKLGEIIASDDAIKSAIQFWTDLGGNKRVTVEEFVNVKANYVYWPEDCGQVGEVAGWYLEDDQDGKYPQNDVEIDPGHGFIFNRYGSEANVELSLPAAL